MLLSNLPISTCSLLQTKLSSQRWRYAPLISTKRPKSISTSNSRPTHQPQTRTTWSIHSKLRWLTAQEEMLLFKSLISSTKSEMLISMRLLTSSEQRLSSGQIEFQISLSLMAPHQHIQSLITNWALLVKSRNKSKTSMFHSSNQTILMRLSSLPMKA